MHAVPAESASGNYRPAVPGKAEAQYGGRCLAVCLSAIMVDGSCLLQVSDRGLRNKFLKGTLHQEEMDRLIGATCDVFNQCVLHTQLDQDMLVFTTTGVCNLFSFLAKILTIILLAATDTQTSAGFGGSYVHSSSIWSPVKPSRVNATLSTKPRPDYIRPVLAATDKDVIYFAFDEIVSHIWHIVVPVYDARKWGFNFESDFDNLDSLP